MRCSCTHITISKGRRQNRKSRKFGTMSQIGLTPPPSDLWDIFEFQAFFIKVKLQNIAKIMVYLAPKKGETGGSYQNYQNYQKLSKLSKVEKK